MLSSPLRIELQAVSDSISQQVSAVLQLYEQNSDSLDLSVVTERSAAAPSLADMLEWLQDAERFYRRQYPSCLLGLVVLGWVLFS